MSRFPGFETRSGPSRVGAVGSILGGIIAVDWTLVVAGHTVVPGVSVFPHLRSSQEPPRLSRPDSCGGSLLAGQRAHRCELLLIIERPF